ncbi:hypothetical protein PTKIN_Ptkin11bG0091000 [Pterospermum kingtungense]
MENSDTKKEQEIGVYKDEKVQSGGGGGTVLLNELPEGCIAKILSSTSPPDACRFSCLSSTFRSAAASDSVWGYFLPSDYQTILSGSCPHSLTKKQLFFYLSHNPVLIDQGKKSFSLDKWSGKKCYMIAARDLAITWGDTPAYWDWISHPESRFKEVAKLNHVWWLEIHGKISTSKLSLDTNYAAYLVFKLSEEAFGFDGHPAEVSLTLGVDKICTKCVVLDNITDRSSRRRIWHRYHTEVRRDYSVMSGLEHPKERADGWLEIEIGSFFNRYGEDELEMRVMEVKAGIVKGGMVVQGIEIRPKRG